MKRINILICDITIKERGHYICFNQYILDNYQRIEKEFSFIKFLFLYNSEAKNLLEYSNDKAERITFLNDKEENANIYKRCLMIKKVQQYTTDNDVNKLIFMDFDKFQLGFSLYHFKAAISGILFRPHHRIQKTNIYNALYYSYKRYKKLIAEKFLLRNNNITSIYILNDTFGVEILNKIHKTCIFKYLPDPIFTFSKTESTHPIKKSNSPYKFLLFGSLDRRKNIKNALLAYDLAHFDFNTEFYLVGTMDKKFKEEITIFINKLKTIDNVHKVIHFRTGYVSDEEMDKYFSLSDVCLFIYKDFYGSSGLLGRAALHKKRVIGSNVGVIKELVNKYQLGLLCDPYNTQELAKSYRNIFNFTLNDDLNKKFCYQNSPEEFFKGLISLS